MSKKLHEFIALLFDKSLSVLSATSNKISIASFGTANNAPVGTASESFSFAFSIPTGWLFNNYSQEDFTKILNEERNYWELKKSIRMMISQGSDTKNIIWLKVKKRHWWNY